MRRQRRLKQNRIAIRLREHKQAITTALTAHEHTVAIARRQHEADEEESRRQSESRNLFAERLAQAEVTGNPEPLAELLEFELDNEEFPIPLVFELAFDGVEHVSIEVALPELDVVPEERTELTKTGKLARRKMARRARVELYADVCAALGLRLIYETLRVLPVVREVEVFGTAEDVDPATGQPQEFIALHIATDRETFGRLNLDGVDPSSAVAGLNGKFSYKKSGELQRVEGIMGLATEHDDDTDQGTQGPQGPSLAMTPAVFYDWMAAVDSFLNLYEKGDNDNAWNSINSAYRIIPTAYLRYWRGVMAGRRKDFAEAARELDAAWKERHDPHRALRTSLAKVAGADPELRDRVNGMTRLRIPENELSVNLAAILYHLSRYADAVSWAERAALDPKHREGALELLARAEHRLGRYSSSLTHCAVLFKETSNRLLKAKTARTAAFCAGRLGDNGAVFKWIELALEAGCERTDLYDSEDLQAYKGQIQFERLLS